MPALLLAGCMVFRGHGCDCEFNYAKYNELRLYALVVCVYAIFDMRLCMCPPCVSVSVSVFKQS